MSGNPAWRMGALGQALALAGYWTFKVDTVDLPAQLGAAPLSHQVGSLLVVSEPLVVLEGRLNVIAERIGARPSRVGSIDAGTALIPIGDYGSRPGVSIQGGEGCVTAELAWPELAGALVGDRDFALHLVSSMQAALDQQHWTLRLAAEGTPMSRLAALLLQIAESRGVQQEEGLLLEGAPDVRELSVLAGVSRENAAIDLEWLIHTRVLRRDRGRLWVRDLEALRRARLTTEGTESTES